MTAREMWSDNADLARACLDHPFVQGIATGALSRARFQVYVGQDAFFLEAFARAYALALAKAPDRDGLLAFRDLLLGVFEELRLHESYARRWGVDLAPEPLPSTTAYTDFLLRTAALEPVGHTVAAMTPCMRLYAYLGQSLRVDVNPQSAYREWVETYASPEFEALAARLEGLVDRYTAKGEALARRYRTAMRLELAFFQGAWAAGA